MRERRALIVGAALVLGAAVASWSMAAPKEYQFTGTVVEYDARGKTISVDKGGDVWEFSTEGQRDLKVKKGDRVTVHYRMIAKKVEPR